MTYWETFPRNYDDCYGKTIIFWAHNPWNKNYSENKKHSTLGATEYLCPPKVNIYLEM